MLFISLRLSADDINILIWRQGLPAEFNPKTGRPRRGGNQGQVDWGIDIDDLHYTIAIRMPIPPRIKLVIL
jgi:hypothetical protein